MESRSRQSFRLHSLDQWSRQMANSRHRRLFLEKLEPRQVLAASPWHNALNPFDVDADGRANAVDRSTLSNFLSANGAVAVPALPTPDPTRQLFYDVSGDFVVDRVDLDELTNFLLGGKDDSPLPPGAMGPVPLGGETESSSSSFGPSGPTGPQTPTVGITVLTHIVEGDPERTTFHITRAPTTGSLTVNFEVDPSSTASPSDYTSAVLASGSVTFADGQSTYHIPVAGIDDSLLENFETLVVKILPSSLYNIQAQAERATSEIHDGEHGLIDTGYTAEWEDEDGWKEVPRDDILWDDVQHRWVPNIPSVLVGKINNISWYKRPFGDPTASWTFFAGDDFGPEDNQEDYKIEGHPWIGHWEIMYRATYGFLSWFQAEEYDWAGNGIEFVHWKKGHDNQKYRVVGSGVEVFPEIHQPVDWHDDYDKVEVHVKLLADVPLGRTATVKLKAFDPDHAADVSIIENLGAAERNFDPNDERHTMPDLTVKHVRKPKDNRIMGGEIDAEGIAAQFRETNDIEMYMTFQGGTDTKRRNFTHFKFIQAQPGNNYKIAAAPKKPGELRNLVDRLYFSTDGITLIYDAVIERTLDPRNQSSLLTVWRTLWLELDSMKEHHPDPMGVDGPFDQPNLPDGSPDPQYDQSVGDLGSPNYALLSANFLPANIEVEVLRAVGYPSFDLKDNAKFAHYLDEATGGESAVADEVRDIANEWSFWVLHLITAYERNRAQDFDADGTDYRNGITIVGTNRAYVFAETIRDRAAFPGPYSEAVPKTVDESRLHQRTVLHEAGHLMGLGHGLDPTAKWNGIMSNHAQWWTDDEAVFTVIHYGTLQSMSRPKGRGDN